MVDMKRGSVGLWFSFALAIFLLSLWIGSMLGSSAAKYWYGNRQPGEGRLLGPERNRVESELADLSAVQTLQLFARIAPNEVEPQDKLLSDEIKGLEQIKRRSNVQEVRSLVDFDLGLAYVDAAMQNGQDDHKELAKTYMQSAQVLFESLGWRDYSEGMLKIIASQELSRWRHPQTKARGK